MGINPYRSQLDSDESPVCRHRNWWPWAPTLMLLVGVVGYVLGTAAIAFGYSLGMRGFDVGTPLPPKERMFVEMLMFGGLGLLLLSIVVVACSAMALSVQCLRYVLSR